MSTESPASVLFSSDGTELAVVPGSAIPAGTRGLLIEGTDGTNARTALMDASGRQVVIGAGTAGTQLGGVVTIQGDPAGTPVPVTGSFTTDGYVTTSAPTYVNNTSNYLSLTTLGGLRIDGVYATGTANGTAADAMVSGGYVTAAAPTYTTGQLDALSLTTAGALRVDGSAVTQPVSGTVAVSSVSGTVAVTQSTSPWVVSGTGGNFNSTADSTTGTAAPAVATFVGALVTTAMESGLTSGDMYPFNLTTTGLLRIDGAYPLTTAVATAVDMSQVGGVVTTAAPTYTTGTINALSLDTAGNLRVTGVGGTFNNSSVGLTGAAPPADATYMGALATTAAESGLTSGDMYPLNITTTGQLRIDSAYPLATAVATAVDMTQVGGVVTTAAPTYTTATANALSLTTVGGLRVDGVYPQGTTNANSPDVHVTGGYTTTAAPAYTTGQLNPLSLDTAGNLRVTAVVDKATTSAFTQVAGATVSTSVLASNASRIRATIYNNTTKNMYVMYNSAAATSSNFSILLMKGSYTEVPDDYTGAINAIWDNGVSGSANITEFTA